MKGQMRAKIDKSTTNLKFIIKPLLKPLIERTSLSYAHSAGLIDK